MLKETKIFIIDDNEAVCQALEFLFDSFYNLKAKIYNNPLHFLKEFSANWKGCILLDLFMPSLYGIDLIKELKKRNNKMEIIVISGHASCKAAAQALAEGAAAFIKKPFKTESLLEKINDILQRNNL